MLNPLQEVRIRSALDAESGGLDVVMQMDSPEEFHQLMLCYNWDDGLTIPTHIATHPNCDLGTALLMYWLLEAPWCDEYPGEGASLVAVIKERILGKRFQNQQIRFDPVSHFHLTKTQLYKFNKAGLPAAFLTPTAGEPFKLGWTS